jgi:hypothetical protein
MNESALSRELERFVDDAYLIAALLVSQEGETRASAGNVPDGVAQRLPSVVEGKIAASDGLARLIGEKEFSILFQDGSQPNLHFSLVVRGVILVAIFDERTSLGLVRLHAKKIGDSLVKQLKEEKRDDDPPDDSTGATGQVLAPVR